MKIIAVTNCTAAKTPPPLRDLQARTIERMALPALADEWHSRIRKADSRIAAASLYRGRGFSVVVRAAARYGVDVSVLSAGLGVLQLQDLVPSYSLTIAPDSRDFILARAMNPLSLTPGDWWKSLTGRPGISAVSDLLDRNKSALIVLGVSSAYLSMIAGELLDLSAREQRRIRIVGPKHVEAIPDGIREMVMPYDKRLNGPDAKIRGTEFDFPQRALASFIHLVRNDRALGTAADHAKRVRLSLGQMRAPKRVPRRKVSDASLIRKIRAIMKQVSSVSAGLRVLRNKQKIACEQHRFSRLWAQVDA